MSETAIRTPVALDATGRCLHCLPVDADIVGLFGHDPLGHRIVSALLRHGVDSVAQLARYTTLELSLVRDLGQSAIERIRTQVPEPATRAQPPAPFTPAAPVFFDDQAHADGTPVTAAERLSLALLARLPVEIDISPTALAQHATAAALWALTAVSCTDPRIWRHAHPEGIAFAPILDEPGWSKPERMIIRLARKIAGRSQNAAGQFDLVELAGTLDDDQWRALLTALQVCRAGLRGEL